MNKDNLDLVNPPSQSRLLLGGAIFISGFLAPLLIPLVTSSGLSTEWKTIISGLLALGVPEVFMVIAITILGKQGFDYLKAKLWAFIRPPDKVSRLRYRLGLLLFILPLIFGWLHPYLELWLPVLSDYHLALAIIGDLVFAASLFVLGGDFWQKLQALFSHDN